jgi:hypothetical protein
MDDIRDPTGRDKSLDTSLPPPPERPHRIVRPESERRGGSQSIPSEESTDALPDHLG